MKKSIMIVDDEADVVETIRYILEREGYKAEEAYSGYECLEKDEHNYYYLIFLDIMMPGMSGYKVAEELRKRHNTNIKIVFISIKPKAEVDLKYADGFVQKPFHIQEIVKKTALLSTAEGG